MIRRVVNTVVNPRPSTPPAPGCEWRLVPAGDGQAWRQVTLVAHANDAPSDIPDLDDGDDPYTADDEGSPYDPRVNAATAQADFQAEMRTVFPGVTFDTGNLMIVWDDDGERVEQHVDDLEVVGPIGGSVAGYSFAGEDTPFSANPSPLAFILVTDTDEKVSAVPVGDVTVGLPENAEVFGFVDFATVESRTAFNEQKVNALQARQQSLIRGIATVLSGLDKYEVFSDLAQKRPPFIAGYDILAASKQAQKSRPEYAVLCERVRDLTRGKLYWD